LAFESNVENGQKLDGVRAPHGLPSIGDSRKVYPIMLTEPEINSIHAVFGYVDSQIRTLRGLPPNEFTRYTEDWWNHYGPTLIGLSARLREFDDGDAPFQSANAVESQPVETAEGSTNT
jgi:hypothetical protein